MRQSLSTREYRYLLSGRLRPLDISAWFGGTWWRGIFGNFAFPAGPPDATVDVRGRYARARFFSVFGYLDSADPVVLGVPLDRLRTLLFIDQSACDGLEVVASRGGGSAQGSFMLGTEPATGKLGALDIEMTSTLDPAPLGAMLPPGRRRRGRGLLLRQPAPDNGHRALRRACGGRRAATRA